MNRKVIDFRIDGSITPGAGGYSPRFSQLSKPGPEVQVRPGWDVHANFMVPVLAES